MMANRLLTMLPLLAVVALAVGCHDTAPKPTFNPFAPLGPSTVAPPATGSFGTPRTGQAQPYYTPNTQANGITAPTGGLRTGAAPSLSTPQASITNASGIRQIGFNEVVGTGLNQTVAGMPNLQSTPSNNSGGGMHVNDATQLAPQPTYQPQAIPTNATQQYGFQAIQPIQPATNTLPPAPTQPAFTQIPATQGNAGTNVTTTATVGNGLTALPPNEVVPLQPIPQVAFPQSQPIQQNSGTSGAPNPNAHFTSPVGNGW